MTHQNRPRKGSNKSQWTKSKL